MSVSLLIGLGNPGRKYRKTRHNIGFVVLDRLAEDCGFKINKKRFKANFSLSEFFGRKICCVKPQNFMNLSGEVVESFWNYYKVRAPDVLVVHDDIDLPLGRLRFSFGAGHGGHNGIRSILDRVSTRDFYRLRLGIGRPPEGMEAADYVLEPFEGDEKQSVDEMVSRAVDAIAVFYKEGFPGAQRFFNK